jgi:glycosyltransferase involved in cell wall biosynthesis
VKLAKHFGARLIIDVRDIWPELFVLAIPPALRMLAPIPFYPFYALRRYAFRNADAVTAVTETYLNVALEDAPHLMRNGRSQIIYFGADVADLREMMEQSDADNQIQRQPGEVWAIYAGTLGNNYDIDSMLQAAVLLGQRTCNCKIIIAGDGPLRQHIVDFIQQHELTNVSYVGSLPFSDLCKYYAVSDIGLSPYRSTSTVVMPAKVYDYLAAGLPVVNSLPGELENFLRENQIGIQYVAGNAESLANALEELAADADKRRTMSQNSYNAALVFDRQTQYLKFLDLLG